MAVGGVVTHFPRPGKRPPTPSVPREIPIFPDLTYSRLITVIKVQLILPSFRPIAWVAVRNVVPTGGR